MAAVASTMRDLGTPAGDFCLPDVSNQNRLVQRADFDGRPLLVMFICNHCPYVLHVIEPLVEIANKAQSDGFGVVAISANDVDTYPQDGPDLMHRFATQYGFAFPYLFDATQAVAKAYRAACTPDFFVYSRQHRLQYRGQMDASRPSNNHPVDGCDLSAALDAVLAEKPTTEKQVPSIGCNIKWRPGNEPDYF